MTPNFNDNWFQFAAWGLIWLTAVATFFGLGWKTLELFFSNKKAKTEAVQEFTKEVALLRKDLAENKKQREEEMATFRERQRESAEEFEEKWRLQMIEFEKNLHERIDRLLKFYFKM